MNDSNSERYELKALSALHYRALRLVIALCFLNFAAYMVIAFIIGGDALNGKIVAGHFISERRANSPK